MICILLGPLKCIVQCLQGSRYKWRWRIRIRSYPPTNRDPDGVYTTVCKKLEISLLDECVSVFLHRHQFKELVSLDEPKFSGQNSA